MKFLKWLLIFVALAWIVLLLIPADYEVQRSITINAPASTVFEEINSFQNWEDWSTWASKDPNMVNNYTGPASGVGNSNEWTSDHRDVGNGSQVMTKSVVNEMIESHMNFGMMGKSFSRINLESQGNRTIATWKFWPDYDLNPLPKLFGLIADMDSMVGPDFETSLATLKGMTEKKHLESGSNQMEKIEARGVEQL